QVAIWVRQLNDIADLQIVVDYWGELAVHVQLHGDGAEVGLLDVIAQGVLANLAYAVGHWHAYRDELARLGHGGRGGIGWLEAEGNRMDTGFGALYEIPRGVDLGVGLLCVQAL